MTAFFTRSAYWLVPATLSLPIALAAQRPPTNVSAFDTKGSITVSWTGVRAKVAYRVLRAPDSKSPGKDLTPPLNFDVTSFVDGGVAPGTSYFYQVIAVYSDGSEGASSPVEFAAAGPIPVPAPAPMPTRAVPTAITALAPVQMAAPPPAPMPAAPITKGAASLGAPIATSTRGVTGRLAAPPAPSGVAVTGTPASASVVWQPVPGVASYVVARKEANQPPQQAKLAATTTRWDDIGLRPSTGYTYIVDAVYPDGREAYTEVSFTTPPAVNPTGLFARQTGPGKIVLSWQPVGAASYYVLLGPGSSYGGVKVPGGTPFPSYTVTGAPTGSQTWSVGSYYDPGPVSGTAPVGPNAVSTAGTLFPKVTFFVAGAPPATPAPVTTVRRTNFNPMINGFHFANTFKNSFVGPPFSVTTGGLCGGMSYAVLDYFIAGTQISNQAYRPANNTLVQTYLYGRQVTSLMENLDKWAEVSVNPLGARTAEFFNWGISGRLAELKSFIDRGAPVPLGLKGAGGGIDHDHQVLAVGYDAGRYKGDLGAYIRDLKIYIFDPNYPKETVTLVPNPAKYEYYELEHPENHWQTYFVDGKYKAVVPPTIVNPSYPSDGLVHELQFEFNTGQDDMRGGADHVDVTIRLSNGTTQYYPNISRNGLWLPWYTETAQVVLSQPVPGATIKGIEVTTNATGGLNGDNWDMNSLSVKAVGGAFIVNLLKSPAGPYRFTGARIPLVIPVR